MLSHSANHYQDFDWNECQTIQSYTHSICRARQCPHAFYWSHVALHCHSGNSIFTIIATNLDFPNFTFIYYPPIYKHVDPNHSCGSFTNSLAKRRVNKALVQSRQVGFKLRGILVFGHNHLPRNKVVFHNTCRLESKLRIPSVLLSLMPFSIEHLEQKGSESLQTAIDKDMEPAAERFQEAYMNWISE